LGRGDGGEEFGELAASDGVESGGGFVEHDDVGLHGQDGGDGGASFLTAGKVVGVPVGEAGGVDGGEGVFDELASFVDGDAEVGRSERDVVAHGGHEELVVGVLEHETDPAPDLSKVGLGDGGVVDGDRARLDGEQPIEVEDEQAATTG
jgi:hypothetical protein